MEKKISLVMPVYNEEKTLADSLIPLCKSKAFHEIIIVNDGSNDGTRKKLSQISKKHKIIIIDKENGGKGSALRVGIDLATGTHIAIMDADVEYRAEDLVKACAMANGVAVFGSRFKHNPELPHGMRIRNAVANLALSWFVNKVAGASLTDVMTCIKVFPIVSGLDLCENGFSVEVELAIKLRRAGVDIVETPIRYFGRTDEEGKKIKPRDFITCVIAIVRYGIWPR